jgi:hypothetical protein
MANPNRTVYEGPALSGPGILWINSRIDAPNQISPDLFKKWYEEYHIPDIIAARPDGCIASSRYECMDSTRTSPYLAVYSIPDLAFVQTNEFKAVSMVHELLPEGGPIHRFVSFDTRFYRRIQLVERPDAPPGTSFISNYIAGSSQPCRSSSYTYLSCYSTS